MDRLEYLEGKATSLSEACREIRSIGLMDRPAVGLSIRLRESKNFALSANGGDYTIWCLLEPWSAGVFRIHMSWSADWDIRDYSWGGADGRYIALSKKEVDYMCSLPLRD